MGDWFYTFKCSEHNYTAKLLINLVPRISHLTAWGEQGESPCLTPGGKMRDPGKEVDF